MLSERLAERVLAVLTERENAATIVGDLLEGQRSRASFWVAIGSIVLHGLNRKVCAKTLSALLLQFLLPLPLLLPLVYVTATALSFEALHRIGLAVAFSTQIAIGLWLGRQHKSSMSACLLLVILDGALGLLNVHNVSVNMALWSVPVVFGTFLARKSVSLNPKLSARLRP